MKWIFGSVCAAGVAIGFLVCIVGLTRYSEYRRMRQEGYSRERRKVFKSRALLEIAGGAGLMAICGIAMALLIML